MVPDSNTTDTDLSQVGHETTDARVGPVVFVAAALMAMVVLSLITVSAMVRGFSGARGAADAERHPLADERVVPPGPRLQVRNLDGITEHRAWETERTGEYAWVDRDGGVVRIPVERAMELVAERGLPVRQAEWDGR